MDDFISQSKVSAPDTSVPKKDSSLFSAIKGHPPEGVDKEGLSASPTADTVQPMPVVKVLSVRGLEYFMMAISLWLGAGGLLWGILSVLNNTGSSLSILAMPASLAVVGILLFSAFFIRLKRAELRDPGLRFDPSKRRTTQITQIFAFLVCVFNIIAFVYTVFTILGGESSASLGKAAINLLVVLAIAGGILAYYWIDEHRVQKV